MQVTTIGLDLAKHVFQIHGIDAAEKVVVRRQLRRSQVMAFFEALAPTRTTRTPSAKAALSNYSKGLSKEVSRMRNFLRNLDDRFKHTQSDKGSGRPPRCRQDDPVAVFAETERKMHART
jgi:transposase